MNRLNFLSFGATLVLILTGFSPVAFSDTLDKNALNNLVQSVSNGKSSQPTKPKRHPTSPDNKIGQMIMVGFSGTSPKHRGTQAIIRQLSEGSIGGVMLMKHNIVSHRQIRRLTSAFRRAARAGNQPPPLISVDQEGGNVQRLKFRRYPSAKRIAGTSRKNAGRVYARLACEVASVGINVNFGPVVDLDIQGRANPIIGAMSRSYSRDPAKVYAYAKQFVSAHKRYGVMTAAKHFPGHGSSLSDSHKGFTAIPNWHQKELKPYRALSSGPIDTQVDMVMVGHLYNNLWGAPASLSNKAISGILRSQIGFSGIVITDDLEMGAIRKNYKWRTALLRAVNAGNDILLYSNTVTHSRFLGRKIKETIAKSLCTNTTPAGKTCIPPRVIYAAYRRIVRAKTDRARTTTFNRAGKCN